MRIDSFHVDGFGVFQATGLEGLSPHLSVFCGPNESGKSTLLGFLRFMLFGLPDKRTKANRYPPLRSGSSHGGRLVLTTSGGKYCLSRHNVLELLLPSGLQGSEENLRDLLSGITRETFNNVFAFSLWELQRLHDAFGQGAVNEALYSATAGLDHQLLTDAEEFLNGGMTELFKSRSRKAVINTALNELEQLHDEIRSAEDKLTGFDRLSGEIASLEGTLRTYQEQQHELSTELDSVKELISLIEHRRKRQADLDMSNNECGVLRRDRTDIHLDAPLLRFSGDILDVLKERGQIVAFGKQKPELQRELEDMRRDFAVSTSKLGPEWTAERFESFQIPASALSEITAKENSLRQLEIQIAEARVAERKAIEDHKAAVERESHAAKTFEEIAEAPSKLDSALLERLQIGRGDYDRATRDLRAREVELRDAEAELSRSLGEIDPQWTEKELAGFDTSLPARQRLEILREQVATADSALERASQQVDRAQEERQKAGDRHDLAKQKYDSTPCPSYAIPATLKDCRDSRDRLHISWAGLSGAITPPWLPVVVAVLGFMLGIACWLLLQFHAAGVLCAVAALLASAWLSKRRRERREAFEGLHTDFASLCRKLELNLLLSKESFDEISRVLDAASEAASQRQHLAEQMHEAAKSVSDTEQDLAKRQQILRSAQATLTEEAEHWRRHLAEIGLAATLSPEGATAVVSRIEVCRERWEKVRGLRHRIEAMERNRREYLQVLNELLAAREQSPANNADAPVRLHQFLEAVRKEDEARSRREEARNLWMHASEDRRCQEDTLLKTTRAHQQALEQQQRLNDERHECLEKHSLPPHIPPGGAGDFLRLIDQARHSLNRTRELDRKLRAITDQELSIGGRLSDLLVSTGRPGSASTLTDMDLLAAALNSAQKHAQEAAVLDARIGEKDGQINAIRTELEEIDANIAQLRLALPREGLDARRSEIASALSELGPQIEERQNRLAESRSRRQALATDERLSQLHERRESLSEQIRQAARKWAILALAFRMFDSARKRFEENRQPAVVRRASTHLQHLTEDRYREVRMPLDGSALNVLPVDDLPKTTEQLSRGTAEQLYLALRFGFIEEFTGNRDPLPIVMDDILVNFDPGRVNATIESLIQLSERFQILYFTCHPNTAQQFRDIDGSIPVFELANGRVSADRITADSVSMPEL